MYCMCGTTCVIQVYIIHMYCICGTTCEIQMYFLHMYYMCRTICIIQVYFLHMYYTCICYTCNISKTPHIYSIGVLQQPCIKHGRNTCLNKRDSDSDMNKVGGCLDSDSQTFLRQKSPEMPFPQTSHWRVHLKSADDVYSAIYANKSTEMWLLQTIFYKF